MKTPSPQEAAKTWAREKAEHLHERCEELLEEGIFGDLDTVPIFESALLEADKNGCERGRSEAVLMMSFVEDYLQHERDCILSLWSAGEPTANGGYRSKYAGQWYQTKPIDETPKCTCGLADTLADYKKFLRGSREEPA